VVFFIFHFKATISSKLCENFKSNAIDPLRKFRLHVELRNNKLSLAIYMLNLLDLIVNESDKSDFIFSYGYLQKTHTARQIVHYLYLKTKET
jgi:hypothetical protein